MSAGIGSSVYNDQNYDTVYFDEEQPTISPHGFLVTQWNPNIKMALWLSFVRQDLIMMEQVYAVVCNSQTYIKQSLSRGAWLKTGFYQSKL